MAESKYYRDLAHQLRQAADEIEAGAWAHVTVEMKNDHADQYDPDGRFAGKRLLGRTWRVDLRHPTDQVEA